VAPLSGAIFFTCTAAIRVKYAVWPSGFRVAQLRLHCLYFNSTNHAELAFA
jgi:hypothetical protein